MKRFLALAILLLAVTAANAQMQMMMGIGPPSGAVAPGGGVGACPAGKLDFTLACESALTMVVGL